MGTKGEERGEAAAWKALPRSFRQQAAASACAVLLETSRRVPGARSYLFTNPIAILEPSDAAGLKQALARIDRETARGRWAAGYLAYEAGYALEPRLAPLLGNDQSPAGRLAWIGIFDAVKVFEHTALGEPESEQAAQVMPKPAAGPITHAAPALSEAPESYARKVKQVHAWIAAGDTYQANLTVEATWQASSPADGGRAIYEAAMAAQPVEYGAWLRLGNGEEILSASPELFFAREGSAVRTRPMKGTAARGRWAEEDARNALWLAQDEKNRAENVMIVDLLRSDLGRICEMGSVHVERLFAVERFPTLLQMTSQVTGTLRAGLGSAEIFKALFPSGSIVGAPKIRTMELLHDLEQRRRGVYTGAIGFQGPADRSAWSVAIRTMHLRDGQVTMGVGSGIVWDSKAHEEWKECQTKLLFLTRRNEPFALIETLLWDERYQRLEAHRARMQGSAEYFDRPFDEVAMRSALQDAARAFAGGGRWRVRLLLDAAGVFRTTATELHAEPGDGLRLLLLPEPTDPDDLFFFHKTTRRQLYDDGLQRARAAGCDDALFCNRNGEITEGAIHNLFLEIDGRQFTPPIACGLLPGVFRAEWLRSGVATERALTLRDLHQAQSVTVTNSVRGARHVREIRQADAWGRVTLLWQAEQSAAALRGQPSPAEAGAD